MRSIEILKWGGNEGVLGVSEGVGDRKKNKCLDFENGGNWGNKGLRENFGYKTRISRSK